MARETCLVTKVTRFSFTPVAEPGRPAQGLISGGKVNYIQMEAMPTVTPDGKGIESLIANLDYTLYDRFAVLPGIYELSFGKRQTRDKGMVETVLKARFLGPVDLPFVQEDDSEYGMEGAQPLEHTPDAASLANGRGRRSNTPAAATAE